MKARFQRTTGHEEKESGGPVDDMALRILVVDDYQDCADSLAMLLESSGHVVKTAYDGASAIVLAHEFKPNIVLLDIALPEMDG